MNFFDQILAADWITRLGWTLLHSLWEIALVTAVLALLLSVLRRGSANVRYLTACGGLAVMAIVPMVTYGLLPESRAPAITASATAEDATPKPIDVVPAEDVTAAEDVMEIMGVPASGHPGEQTPVTSSPATVVASDALQPTTEVPATEQSQESSLQQIAAVIAPWTPSCVVAWFVGVFVVSMWNLGGWIAAQRLKRLGTNPVAEELSRRLSTLAERSGINRSVAIMKSLMVEVPVVVGWLWPMILLPAGILTGLTPAQLDAILAHELAHIRRHDYLVNLLQTVIETLFFYHPGVWWLSRQIRAEREHCCDDVAVAVCGNKVDYASALAAVEAGRATPKMVMAARKADSSTLGRIRRVLGLAGSGPRRWGRSLAGGLITSAMVVALVTCFVVAGEGTTEQTDWSAAAAEVFPDWKIAESGRYEKADIGTAEASRLVLSRERRERVGPPGQQSASIGPSDTDPNDPNFRSVFSRVDIYTFDEKADLPKDVIEKLSWAEWEDTDGHFVKTVDLGTGLGRRWFVRTTLVWQDRLRTELKLTGGDDPIRLLAEGLLVKDKGTNTASSVVHLLAPYGDKAVAHLKRQINKPHPAEDLSLLVRPLAYIHTEAADDLLKVLYADPRTERAAGYAAICGKPRKGNKAIYLDLLKKRQRIRPVGVACVTFNWQEAAPILHDIYTTAKHRTERELSFTAWRNLQGRPIPEELTEARYEIVHHAGNPEKAALVDKARNTILDSPDKEAAAFIATCLADCSGFKTSRETIEAIHRIGKELVTKLADEASDLTARRNELLAEADAKIRTGLVKLAQKYPYLKKAKAWRTVSDKSGPGRIGVFIVHTKHQGSKAAQPTGDPEGEEVTILVMLEEPRSEENQLAGPIYPNLGLVGQISTRADNRNLDAELKQLVDDALRPLRDLDATDVSDIAWGQAVEGIQCRLRADKHVWRNGENPTFEVDMRNKGVRGLNTSLIASLAVEVDGEVFAPRAWFHLGIIRVSPFGPGAEYTIGISRSDFTSTDKRAQDLAPGKHTVRVVLLNNLDGSGIYTSLDKYKEMTLAFSNAVEIEIVADNLAGNAADVADAAWGDPVDGVACAVRPVKATFAPGDDIVVDVMYRNVSDKPITVCVYPDALYTWIHVWVKTAEGQNVMGGPHGTGFRFPSLKLTDFVTLQPEQTASFRQVIPSPPHGPRWPKPGKYYIHAEINKINRMDKHCLGFAELCKKHGLNPWVAGIESGATPVLIDTEDPPAAQPAWGKVTERTIADPRSGGPQGTLPCLIDFDTGRVLGWPVDGLRWFDPERGYTDGFKRFMATNGLDAIARRANSDTDIDGLVGFGMTVVPVNNDQWDIEPRLLAERLANAKPRDEQAIRRAKLRPGGGELPRTTYLFRTREGRMGVLQITLVTSSTTVRYKLLQTAEETAAWSDPVDDLRTRLRPTQRQWKSGVTPTLSLDLWNDSDQDKMHLYLGQQKAECEIEIDGQWYRWADTVAITQAVLSLKAGQARDDAVKISLIRSWARTDEAMYGRPVDDALRLNLTPGKHTLRVAFTPDSPPPQEKRPRIVSNPIEIEIVSKSDDTTTANPLGLDDDTLVKIYRAGSIVQRVAHDCESFYRDRDRLPKDVPDQATRYQERSRASFGIDLFAPGERLRLIHDKDDSRRVQVWSVGPDGDWDGGRQIDSTKLPLDGDLGVEIRVGQSDWHWLADEGMKRHLKGERLAHYLAAKGPKLPRPELKDDGLQWGPVVDGLQAAIELSPKKDAYLLGETIAVRFHIRNAADYAIQVGLQSGSWQDMTPLIHDAAGRRLKGRGGAWGSGTVSIMQHTLKPGATVSHPATSLAFVAPGKQPWAGSVGHSVEAAPGVHTIQFNQQFPMGYRAEPREWRGLLETVPVKVRIAVEPKFAIHRVRGYRKQGDRPGMTSTLIFRESGNPARFDATQSQRYPLDDLVFDGAPLLTETDILTYDWKNHSIKLKPGVGERLHHAVKLGSAAVPFVVQTEGKPIYLGAFWPPYSSNLAKLPHISLIGLNPAVPKTELITKDTIDIQNSQVPVLEEGGTPRDPRPNQHLKAALQKAGKLVDVRSGEPPWGKAAEGVKLQLQAGEFRDGYQWVSFDLHNDSSDLSVQLGPNGRPDEIIIGDLVYVWGTGVAGVAGSMPVCKPGKQNRCELKLDENWMPMKMIGGSGMLKLKPGKHTVRAAVYATGKDDNNRDRKVRVLSNPVEIKIVAENDEKGDAMAELLRRFETATYFWQQLDIAEQIVKTGDRSVISQLLPHLDSEDEHLRCNAGFVLAGLGDDRGLEAIISELKTKKARLSERIRSDTGRRFLEQRYGYYAIQVLGKLRDKRAVPVLIEFLDKEEKFLSIEWALGEIGDKRAIGALKRVLEHEDPRRHLWAGCALAKLGDPVGIPTVAKFLKDPTWVYRRHAVEGLGASGDTDAVPHLIEALSDDSPDVRVSACKALATLADARALPALEKLLGDRTMTETSGPTMVRDSAREAIASIRKEQPEAATPPEPIAWGKPLKGVRAALVAEKPVPGGDTMPAFLLRLESEGLQNLAPELDGMLFRGAFPLQTFALELDGLRYRLEIIDNFKLEDLPIGFNENTGKEEAYQFRFQRQDSRLTVNRYWQAGSYIVSLESYRLVAVDPETDKPLAERQAKLTPGKHRIRVGAPIFTAIRGYPVHAFDQKGAQQRAWSNAVAIDVLAKELQTKAASSKTTVRGSVFTLDPGLGRDGTIRGKVIGTQNRGEAVIYSVTLDHEEWTNRLGALPHLVVAAGEPFEFRNVPAGKCKVRAQAVTAAGQNTGVVAKAAEVEVIVKNKQVVEVELEIAAAENTDTSEPDAEGETDSTKRTAPSKTTVRGKVVDDETGEPVTDFFTQGGKFDPANPAKVTWGYTETRSSRNKSGKFSATVRWPEGWTARIVAPGYLAQPVLTEPPLPGQDSIEVVVRLKRGDKIRGRVRDHTGKPVANAGVYLAGRGVIRLAEGPHDKLQSPTVRTDAEGRFEIDGRGEDSKAIFVTAPSLYVWRADLPEPGQEAIIRLPEPAKLLINYDIEGGSPAAQVRIELRTWDMPKWKALVDVVRWVDVKPGEDGVVIDNLPPGVYDISRIKHIRTAASGRDMMLDRQKKLTLASGKTTVYDFVRKKGTPITGEVVGLPEKGVAGVYLSVRDQRASGDPRNRDDWKLRTFDGLALEDNGPFKTERISPGKYKVVVEAYRQETREEMARSGMRLPKWTGTAEVDVPESGEPPKVRVTMHLRDAR
ncbi:MAG: HEAT repeat domain-containing protein [Candidatus Nealsonbacteria bacterium]|nr:HEAT repeat domain-containing protein [Candidatus Nealsonbacteria bacterium]